MNKNILESLKDYEDKLYDIIFDLDKMEENLQTYSEVESKNKETSNSEKLQNNSKKIEQAYSLLESVRNDLLDIIDSEEEIER